MPDDLRLAVAVVGLAVELAPAVALVVLVGVLAGLADVMTLSAVGTSRRGRS